MSDILYRTTKAAYKQGHKSAIGGLTVARNELTKVTEQRDRMAEALRKLADPDWMVTEMYAARKIADEALQSLNKPTKTKTK